MSGALALAVINNSGPAIFAWLGWGGVTWVARATGFSRRTIQQGMQELQQPERVVEAPELHWGRVFSAPTSSGKGPEDPSVKAPGPRADEAGHLDAGEPVISVDAKKKELVGNFKNGGRELRPQGDPERVRVYDFVIPALGRATPYGIYDVAENSWLTIQRRAHASGSDYLHGAHHRHDNADSGGSLHT